MCARGEEEEKHQRRAKRPESSKTETLSNLLHAHTALVGQKLLQARKGVTWKGECDHWEILNGSRSSIREIFSNIAESAAGAISASKETKLNDVRRLNTSEKRSVDNTDLKAAPGFQIFPLNVLGVASHCVRPDAANADE